jgi:O-antigen/teichoic acid export membrane protein
LARVLTLTAVVVCATNGSVALLQRPLIALFFGTKYPHALDAMNALIVGLTLYAFAAVLANAWGALGRPLIGAVATGVATAVTIAVALVLIPQLGLLGAGVGFAAGAGAQLFVIGSYTAFGVFSGASIRIGHLGDEPVLSG